MDNPPPYLTPTKDRRRHITAVLCFGLIALLILWTAGVNLRQRWMSPQMSSALDALNSKSPIEARTLFESALREAPRNPALYGQVLEACETKGYWDLMVVFGERAVQECRESPESVRALLYSKLVQGYLRAKCKDWKRLARDAALRTLELEPANPSNQNLYGYVLADTFVRNDKQYGNPQDLDKAEQLLVQAMKAIREASPLGTADPAVAVNLVLVEDSYAWLLVKRERYEDAANLLADIVSRGETDDLGTEVKEIYYHLGVAYNRLGREDDARQQLKRALAYDPKFAEANAELYCLPHTSIPPPTKKN